MLGKRGLTQIDWAISIAIFILYMSWFFILIKPYYMPADEMSPAENVEEEFLEEVSWTVNKTPIMVFSGIDTTYEPVSANFSLAVNESNFAFSDNNYFTLFEGSIYFLANLQKGRNLFWLISSDETYPKKDIMTDLQPSVHSTSVSSMTATYHDGLLRKAYYKNNLVLENFRMIRNNAEIESLGAYFNSSRIMSVQRSITEAGFNHTSLIFAYNPRIYNSIKLHPFTGRRSVILSMTIHSHPGYYADNANFGEISYPEECKSFEHERVFFYNDDNVVAFILENKSDIDFCYSGDDQIELNITLHDIETEQGYKIFFEPLAVIPNGDFSEGWKYWRFVDNMNPYRNCTSMEGTSVLITEDSDPFISGDWSNSSISGLPVAGFGSNKSILDGTGGSYDGRLISSPFIVPDYASFIHIWRHFDLNSFDNHGSMPDAAYLEIRDADTDGLLKTIDSWESAVNNSDYDLGGTKIVNISDIKGRKARISLNLIGHEVAGYGSCDDGNDDDALVQIDDVYFSDQTGSQAGNEFNYTAITSRISLQDYQLRFGAAQKITGISLERISMLANLSNDEIIARLGRPSGTEFRISLYNST